MTLAGEAVEAILAEVLPAEVWGATRDRQLTESFARYVGLLMRWNRTVNLTSARTPEQIVRRHLAESLCCAVWLPECDSVLDLGSGAGFPGIPIQLMRPGARVTLAESHGKKAAFLREAVRELGLGAEVFAGRAQELPDHSFACVSLRAVDPIEQALEAAALLARNSVCVLGSSAKESTYSDGLTGWKLERMLSCIEGGSAIFFYKPV